MEEDSFDVEKEEQVMGCVGCASFFLILCGGVIALFAAVKTQPVQTIFAALEGQITRVTECFPAFLVLGIGRYNVPNTPICNQIHSFLTPTNFLLFGIVMVLIGVLLAVLYPEARELWLGKDTT